MQGMARRGVPAWLVACLVLCAALAIIVLLHRGFPHNALAPAGEPALVESYPITHFRRGDPLLTRFGNLEFIGGFEMRSRHRHFGGLSGFRFRPDGRGFLAVTDVGDWITGTMRWKDGRPDSWADVMIRPIVGPGGSAAKSEGYWDAESLWLDPDGTAFVGYERRHRVLRYQIGTAGLGAVPDEVFSPAPMRRWPANNGPEALFRLPVTHPSHGGRLVAIQERPRERDGPSEAYVLGEGGFAFFVRRSDRFDITDADVLPSGDIVLLERHFHPLRGVAMRLRRIPLASIRPDATVDGEILLQVDASHQIDNMESLAITQDAAGETRFTLVSDDNFSIMQRSIVLQFRWLGN
jgi:hypothetical protein